MMYSRDGKWLDKGTIAERAAKFLEWANRVITPDPIAKFHPEGSTTNFRAVDPYADTGIWVIVDEGAISNTHSDHWMKDAFAKWAKRGFKPVVKSSTVTKFSGVGILIGINAIVFTVIAVLMVFFVQRTALLFRSDGGSAQGLIEAGKGEAARGAVSAASTAASTKTGQAAIKGAVTSAYSSA